VNKIINNLEYNQNIEKKSDILEIKNVDNDDNEIFSN
jgi:hypothetical protein